MTKDKNEKQGQSPHALTELDEKLKGAFHRIPKLRFEDVTRGPATDFAILPAEDARDPEKLRAFFQKTLKQFGVSDRDAPPPRLIEKDLEALRAAGFDAKVVVSQSEPKPTTFGSTTPQDQVWPAPGELLRWVEKVGPKDEPPIHSVPSAMKPAPRLVIIAALDPAKKK